MKKKYNWLLTYYKTVKLLCKVSPQYLFFTVVLSLIIGISTPITIYIWKDVINSIESIIKIANVSIQDINILFKIIIIYLIVKQINCLAMALMQYVQNIYSDYINKDIAELIFKKVLSYKLETFDNSNMYNEIEKANTETAARSLSILQILVNSIQYITAFIGTAMILLPYSKFVVLGCIVTSIPAFYVGYRIMNKLYEVYNRRFERNRFINAIKKILTNSDSLKEIKIFGSGYYLLEKIEKSFKKNIGEDKKLQKKITLENVATLCFDDIGTILLKGVVIGIGIKNKVMIGTIMMNISAVDSVKNSLKNLLSVLSTACEDCLYMQSFFNICEQKARVIEKPDFSEEINSIEFIDVSFKYPKTEGNIINRLNMRFVRGKNYAIIGANGSGKSTVIKLLCGLYYATEGKILINGQDIRKFNTISIYNKIGCVFQEFVKYPLSIKENIAISNIQEKENEQLIKEAAKRVGLDQYIEKLPDKYNTQLKREWTKGMELSGGQWQRVAVSRCFMKDFDVLIMDEPSASLDIMAEKQLYDNLQKLNRKNLSVFVTHRYIDPDLIDEIIVLDKGKIVQKGTPKELSLCKGFYSDMLKTYKIM
ncbi:MAG: ABC transporter ATP-binding protein [Erysipelotrichaceae bacterium]|nr:ABC transporter ATP-binding protein [Erysipelotrichaceae bacterium]